MSTSKIFITGKAKDNTPEILVYGYIGGEDVCSGDFIKELRSLEKTSAKINIRINSGGGSVFEGIAIFNAILNSKAEVTTYVDGLAASMATIIALAGKKVYMSKIARFMTHKPSGMSSGNGDQMRKDAQLVDSLELTMAGIYAAKTGKTPEECKTLFMGEGDKWFTAQQALAEGLIDGIYDAPAINAVIEGTGEHGVWDFYNKHRFAAVFTSSKFNNQDMKIENLSAASLAALNITGDITDVSAFDTAIAALKAKADQADVFKAEKETAEAALATLKADSVKADLTAQLEKAIAEKRITVEQKNLFATQYADKPEDLKELLAVMPPFKSVVTPTTELGDATKAELAALMAKSGKELWTSGGLARLKELSAEGYKVKYKEAFDDEPDTE